MAEPVVVCWSGGKDSSLALERVLGDERLEVATLLTTVTEGYERISMHGVRRELLEMQAAALGLGLEIVYIAQQATNELYERRMRERLLEYRRRGIGKVVFGDIFLEDLKRYRQERLAEVSMEAVFPIWKEDTRFLAGDFVSRGFKAILSCVDSQHLGGEFSGRDFDGRLLEDLPEAVDPCGENGEFHSFVYDGPIFSEAVEIERGEVVLRDERFWYCDMKPARQS